MWEFLPSRLPLMYLSTERNPRFVRLFQQENPLIKSGDTAFIRTTNEEVFVLELSDTNALVRRPVMTQNGIEHRNEEFTRPELETLETRVLRNYAEQKMLRDKVEALDAPATPNAPLPITQAN